MLLALHLPYYSVPMSRYRPPQTPGSKYITPEGKKRLSDEFEFLWREKRPEVTAALAAAAAEGDRSENAEYIYRKKQLREIDARIHHLKDRLEHIVVVDSRRQIPHGCSSAPGCGSRTMRETSQNIASLVLTSSTPRRT